MRSIGEHLFEIVAKLLQTPYVFALGVGASAVERRNDRSASSPHAENAQVGGFAMRFAPRFERFRFWVPLVLGALSAWGRHAGPGTIRQHGECRRQRDG